MTGGAQLTFEVATPDAMHDFGVRLAALLGRGDVIVLTGPLGAGKTTLARGIGAGLGVRGPVSSPTFVIARTHPPLGDGAPLIHVDAYRLRDALDLDDLDLDLDASVTVIEWGRDTVGAITDAWLDIELARPRAAVPGDDAESRDESPHEASHVTDADAEAHVPRMVRVTAVGERWSTPRAVAALAGAAGTATTQSGTTTTQSCTTTTQSGTAP